MRSGLMIVCNGFPFISHQLENIYDCLDEIVIVEGADAIFTKLICSMHSIDGTIDCIESFPDPKDKIKLIQIDRPWNGKNEMVAVGAEQLHGDCYHIDVDEFMPPELIDACFKMIEAKRTWLVDVPSRWYYKWDDTFIASNRPNHLRMHPSRFYRRHPKGYPPSHIPWSGYQGPNGYVHGQNEQLETDLFCSHYFARFRSQFETKYRYYNLRGDFAAHVTERRLKEFDEYYRNEVGTKPLESFDNMPLLIDPNPIVRFNDELPNLRF